MSTLPMQNKTTRRGFIDWVIRICGGIAGVALVGPAVAYLLPVTKSGPIKTREEVGNADGWEPWSARKVAIGGKPAIVIRTDQEFVALSAVCPHLGCLVEFDAAKRVILCPCHAGVFDLKGAVTSGPPPKPLANYATAVVQGKVYVSI